MELTFKFFNTDNWGIYASLQTLVVLGVFMLGQQKIDIQTLVLASLIGMMSGDQVPRLVFAFFLCLLIYQPLNKHLLKVILVLISTLLTGYIKFNNPIQQLVMRNKILYWLMKVAIYLWMLFFSYIIINDFG